MLLKLKLRSLHGIDGEIFGVIITFWLNLILTLTCSIDCIVRFLMFITGYLL